MPNKESTPLVDSPLIRELVSQPTGFYLSCWDNGGIRFSYFTNAPEQTVRFLNGELSSLGLVEYIAEIEPHDESFQDYRRGNTTNLQFRRFLQLITNMGLDLLEYDILYSRRLAAKYRLEIAPLGVSCKPYFETAFEKIPYYDSLTSELKKELLDGLDYWHTSWEDWAHMFVVMLLPGDWIYSCSQVFDPRRPVDKAIRESLSKGLLPDSWEP